ncbi:MAG TPA: GNAT family N-acetyltransferase [Terriglobales bacterium]|nr:GNAT family N-acetyltransferase [Terriglobales bacterium]
MPHTIEKREVQKGRMNANAKAMSFEILRQFPGSEIEKAWRDCLARVDFPSHYNTPEYFYEPYWPEKPRFAVLALEESRVTGILTGMHDGNRIMCGLPSRPQICVDPSSNTTAALDALARGVLSEARNAELVAVFTWPSLELPAFRKLGFKSRQLPGNVVLDLTQGPEELFKQFSKDRRRNIRFAEKNGIVIEQATTPEQIKEAYEVYSAWRKTQRKEVRGEGFSFEVFDKAARLTGNRVLMLARLSGKVVAINIFRYCPGGLFESAANSSLDEFIHLKPNELLQWRGIEWACQHGLRRHSLGGSHQFLTRFGGSIVPILRYRRDQTLFRKHDVRDAVRQAGRETLGKMPPSVGKKVRKFLGEH